MSARTDILFFTRKTAANPAFKMAEIFDHRCVAVKHGRARVNGIRMHYVTAGAGEPLLLLHGVPKTHFYY